MGNEYQEYVIFNIIAKDGSEVEMAVVDEFDFEEKHYVVGAVVQEDTILDAERYIYLSVENGEDFNVEKIESEEEYGRVAEAYLQIEE